MAEKKDREHPKGRDSLLRAFEKMGNTIEVVQPVRFHPTGILSLDTVLHGGFPIGRMVLWYGFTGVGKSTTSYIIIRNYGRAGDRCLLIDTERTFDAIYAGRLGMDLDMLDVIKPNTLEQAWDIMMMALESKTYKLIVLDTLAKLSPSTEAGASAAKQHMGLGPRINSQATRMWGPLLEKSEATVLVLNQERTDIGGYGAPNTNPGGKAIEHEAAVCIYMMGQGKAEYEGSRILRYQVRRSKVFNHFNPYDIFEIHLVADEEHTDVDTTYELFYAAQSLGIFADKDGNPWVNRVAFFDGEQVGNGEKAILTFLDQPSELRDRIEQRVMEELKSDARSRRGRHPIPTDDGEGDVGANAPADLQEVDDIGQSDP